MCVGFLLSNFFAVGKNNGKNKEVTWFFKQERDKSLLPFGFLLCKICLLHIYILKKSNKQAIFPIIIAPGGYEK